MSAYKEFKKTGFKAKTNIIKKYGVYVTSRRAYGCIIRLFAIRDFYVEVWRTPHLPWLNIMRIKSFRRSRDLDPYIEKVDVRGVLSA